MQGISSGTGAVMSEALFIDVSKTNLNQLLAQVRNMDEVNNMRSDLAKQGIEASLVRTD